MLDQVVLVIFLGAHPVVAGSIRVTTGRFHLPALSTRTLTAPEVLRCVSEVVKISEGYCVPTSLFWRSSVVGA